MTIKRHGAVTKKAGGDVRTPDKNFRLPFSFANSCRQIHIFCASFIISSHLATMAIGSANPGLGHKNKHDVHPMRDWNALLESVVSSAVIADDCVIGLFLR